MTPEELQIFQSLKDDFEHFARVGLRIRTKSGSVEPFKLNEAQRYIHACLEQQRKETGKVRAIVLKGRQMGASTYIEGRYYWKVTHRKGVQAYILTHEAESTAALFKMAERYHENCPEALRVSTGASNAKELSFDVIDSGYKVGTAGNKAVGRGTTLQYFHGSEVAYWPHAAEHAKGILQAVPDAPDTEVVLESTANGIGNYFHQMWQLAEAGDSEYQAVFVPWYWQSEYVKQVPEGFTKTPEEQALSDVYSLTDEQIMFRRSKVAELGADGVDGTMAFKQEYPMTASEAFSVSGNDQLIKPEFVIRARKTKTLAHGDLIIGVDPARYGEDRTAIVRRKGRAIYDIETHKGRSTMEVAGMVHSIILAEKPAQVAIDVGGLGAGVVDRLLELGHDDIVVAVNFGSSALDPKTYINRRAEMWWTMRNWLAGDLPVMIPDSDELHSDLCGPSYKFDSQSRRKLETKDEMRKRGIRSPDIADAMALTFAEPIVRNTLPDMEPIIADTVAGY